MSRDQPCHVEISETLSLAAKITVNLSPWEEGGGQCINLFPHCQADYIRKWCTTTGVYWYAHIYIAEWDILGMRFARLSHTNERAVEAARGDEGFTKSLWSPSCASDLHSTFRDIFTLVILTCHWNSVGWLGKRLEKRRCLRRQQCAYPHLIKWLPS